MTETTTELAGYRSAIMLMRKVAELAEKRPDLPKPDIAFSHRAKGVGGVVKYHAWGTRSYDYKLGEDQRREMHRKSIEAEINGVTAMFGPDLQWVSNDPSESSYEKSYFTLTADWDGVKVIVMTQRNDIGEEVTELESGPAITEVDGAVRAIRQTATLWRPNVALAALATPAYELEAPVQLQELEVLEVLDV